MLDHDSTVGDAVEKGLPPIPRGVEADGPPKRTGTPQAEAEDHPGQEDGEQSDRGFAGVVGVADAEQDGEHDG